MAAGRPPSLLAFVGHGCHKGCHSIMLQYGCHAALGWMPCSPLPGLLAVLWRRWAMAAVAGILFTELIGVGQPWWTQPLQVCQAREHSDHQDTHVCSILVCHPCKSWHGPACHKHRHTYGQHCSALNGAHPKLQPFSRHCPIQSLSLVLACCVVQARYPLPLQVGLPVSIAIFATLEGARYRNWLNKGEGGEWPGPHHALHLCILLHRLHGKPWHLTPCMSSGRHTEN